MPRSSPRGSSPSPSGPSPSPQGMSPEFTGHKSEFESESCGSESESESESKSRFYLKQHVFYLFILHISEPLSKKKKMFGAVYLKCKG